MVNQTFRVKHAGEHVANRSLSAKFIYLQTRERLDFCLAAFYDPGTLFIYFFLASTIESHLSPQIITH